jgi:hypothetical protein
VNDVVYVATSPQTEQAARAHGLDVRPFTSFGRLDLAIDGADQTEPTGWPVKGGGAHTREKVVAAAERFIIIASSNKLIANPRSSDTARTAAVRAGVDALSPAPDERGPRRDRIEHPQVPACRVSVS